ncbi:hypothetical protein U4960_06150 [Altererythrobacter sp. H2]|uniref:hypothetical protein n=1 Tax=Altererythrobacter sp. H2 TaxID=3108391 RepID=UPI002B4C0AFD|nr:hypothetical protein [Altererythrobacter sp. H2]WRK96896.1 hypothetical protein U4960_06150 [Altererythrobacter sp. H2]
MAFTIDERLNSLRMRRKGIDRLGDLSFSDQENVLAKSILNEGWETRQSGNKYTRYALGAMQSVGSEYTAITVETAERVGKQLNSKLTQITEFRLQGSVPLNVHIRGVSDVDLLVIDQSFFIYDAKGCLAHTYSPSTLNRLGVILALRADSERILKDAYPAVKVDCSGGKAISMKGGSLPRPVDVVPSIWYNTSQFQSTAAECFRAVVIADKNVPMTIDNQPFMHIKLVEDADIEAGGCLKKAIRLIKNVKADSDREDVKGISSFDLAALLYHADKRSLSAGRFYELAVLAEVQRFLDWVYGHRIEAMSLYTPDGSRHVLDSEAKFKAVQALSFDVDELAKKVAVEQSALAEETSMADLRKVLRDSVIL